LDSLTNLTATEAVKYLKKREISAVDLVYAAINKISEVDKFVNALPTLAFDKAIENAKYITDNLPREIPRGYLYGLPIAIKDLTDVKGILSTKGSKIFKNYIPQKSDVLVENLQSKDAVIIAKSNTPEFGAGANTFNDVFGKTLNPWDLSKTCGGSSGGSAVALATGQVWLATGSDLGGSLRIPASFCSVVGLRPTAGLVSHGPTVLPFNNLTVEGPMARNVLDVSLLLDAQSGINIYDPISMHTNSVSYVDSASMPTRPFKIAYSPDLGIAKVDSEVLDICSKALSKFETGGSKVELIDSFFHKAEDTFQVLRAAYFAMNMDNVLKNYRAELKEEIVWNIEKGLDLTSKQIFNAELNRGSIVLNTTKMFKQFDIFVCPTVLTPPFDVNLRYLEEIDGVKFDTYIGWLALTFALTLTGCPVISIPCGFTKSGLPVGLQIMAPWNQESKLLSVSAYFESILGLRNKVPISPVL
tara:strand:+ start:25227 stop:26642 length:1416 start_codon:yes stop_codon:yes gene_type:complete